MAAAKAWANGAAGAPYFIAPEPVPDDAAGQPLQGVGQGAVGRVGIVGGAKAGVARHVKHPAHLHAMAAVRGGPPRLQTRQEMVDGETLVLVVGVGERREREFAIANVLRRHVRPAGFHDEGKVLRRTQEVGNKHVNAQKMREVLEGKPPAQAFQFRRGQVRQPAVPFRQDEQGFGLDRTFQVDVNLGFGQGIDPGCKRRLKHAIS